jgi:hypothetical protein
MRKEKGRWVEKRAIGRCAGVFEGEGREGRNISRDMNDSLRAYRGDSRVVASTEHVEARILLTAQRARGDRRIAIYRRQHPLTAVYIPVIG